MPEYIELISKKEIYTSIQWPIHLIGFLSIVAIMISLIVFLKTKKDKAIIAMGIVGFIGLILILVMALICSIFLKVPTGRYRYEASIDRENMTVSQYEEFLEEYQAIKLYNGNYYWEDKPVN